MHSEDVHFQGLPRLRDKIAEVARNSAELNMLGLHVVGDVAAVGALVVAGQAAPRPLRRPDHLTHDQVVKLYKFIQDSSHIIYIYFDLRTKKWTG